MKKKAKVVGGSAGFDKNLFFVNPFSNVYRLIGVRKNKIGRGCFPVEVFGGKGTEKE